MDKVTSKKNKKGYFWPTLFICMGYSFQSECAKVHTLKTKNLKLRAEPLLKTHPIGWEGGHHSQVSPQKI